VSVRVCACVCVCVCGCVHVLRVVQEILWSLTRLCGYEVAPVSRIDKITGLFCKRAL